MACTLEGYTAMADSGVLSSHPKGAKLRGDENRAKSTRSESPIRWKEARRTFEDCVARRIAFLRFVRREMARCTDFDSRLANSREGAREVHSVPSYECTGITCAGR